MTEVKELKTLTTVYEGISRMMVRIPRYEGIQVLRALAACKVAKMPPSKLIQDALKNGHGYQVVTQESFKAPFEQQVSESDYKIYPNAIIAYGLKDSDIRLLDSANLENEGNNLVQSSRALVLQNEIEDKVLDVLIIFFDDQPLIENESFAKKQAEQIIEDKWNQTLPEPQPEPVGVAQQSSSADDDVRAALLKKWILEDPQKV